MSQFPGQGHGQWPAQQPQRWGQAPAPQNHPQPGRPTGWPAGPAPRQPSGQFGPVGPWPAYQNWQQPAPQYPGPGQGFRPPPPPPRRGNTMGLVLAVGVLGLAIVFGLFAWGRSRDTVVATTQTIAETSSQVLDLAPTPSQPPTTSEPPSTEPPTTEPPVTTEPPTTEAPPSTAIGLGVLPQRSWDQLPGPHSTNEHWVTLQQNTLYAADVPTMSCPAIPTSFDSAKAFQTFASTTLDCQYAGWVPAFAGIGVELPMPKVTFIDGAVQSPCGKSGENVSFYCGTWDGSSYGIYVHTSLIEQSNEWWRLRAFETLAHEFGHHVQMVSGIMWAAQQVTTAGGMQNAERSRRMELQTSCWAGRLLLQTPATQFNEADLQTYIDWTQRDQDEWHGSRASNEYWWQRGMYMTKVGGCNTFTVGPERVS